MRRRKLTTDEVVRRSKALCARLWALPDLVAAPMLAVYMASDEEIDVSCICINRKQEGESVFLPRYNPGTGCYELVKVKDLQAQTRTGHYGIREPLKSLPALPGSRQNSRKLTWLIPGLAFDKYGHRLGRGGGYYDRLLKHSKGCKIGIGYDWQIIEQVPASGHDVNMDLVVTDKRTVDCRIAA